MEGFFRNRKKQQVFTKEFFEEYPLYRKMKVDRLPDYLGDIAVIRINMHCKKCNDIRTFISMEYIHRPFQYNISSTFNETIRFNDFKKINADIFVRCIYRCSDCRSFHRYFLIKI